MYIDEIIAERFDGAKGVCKRGRKIDCIRFVDNIIILGENKKKFEACYKI